MKKQRIGPKADAGAESDVDFDDDVGAHVDRDFHPENDHSDAIRSSFSSLAWVSFVLSLFCDRLRLSLFFVSRFDFCPPVLLSFVVAAAIAVVGRNLDVAKCACRTRHQNHRRYLSD